MPVLSDFHPFPPETLERPYPFYAATRRDAPVYEVPGMESLIVSRYEDLGGNETPRA